MVFRLLLPLALATALTACGSSEPRVLVVEVTGTAQITELTFTLDGQTSTEQSVSLPWRKEVTVAGGDHEWELVLNHGGGSMRAVATLDGAVVSQTTGSGSEGTESTGRLSGSFSD